MEELRRVRSGIMDEYKDLYTMHDILDAQYHYETKGDESYLRKIIKPIENLLVDIPKIIVKDTAVNAICYGGKLLLPGVLRFSHGIDINQEIVLVSTKGEAIAVGVAQMTGSQMMSCDHGIVAKIKRVIMDKDVYPRRWGLGPRAQRKKNLKKLGLLDEKGRPTPETPRDWIEYYIDEKKNNIVAKEAVKEKED